MHRISRSLAIVGSVSVLSAFQQPSVTPIAEPDFSGHWTCCPGDHPFVIEGRGNSPAGQLQVGTGCPKLVISQTADRLRIEVPCGEGRPEGLIGTLTIVGYAFNGQAVKNQFAIEPLRGSAPSEITSKWEENKLVSTIDVFVPGESEPRHYVETLSISPNGDLAVRIQRVDTPDSRTLFYRRAK